MADDLLLSASGITRSFGSRNILAGCDIALHKGECVGLIGANGAGKSTLLAILAGDLRPDRGEIAYAPQGVGHSRRLARAGLIAQRFTLDPGLTVAQTIFRGAGLSQSEERERARTLLAEAGIALNPSARISGLTRADLGLIESLHLMVDDGADIVLVDEVSATFNVRELDELQWIIGRITGQGRSVLFVSHQLDEVASLCNRVLLLKDGRLSTAGSLGDIEHISHDVPVAMATPRDNSRKDTAVVVSDMLVGEVGRASFEVAAGEVVGLLGTRSSGLHDVVAALSGQSADTAGQIRLHGHLVDPPTREALIRRGVGHHRPDASRAETAANLLLGLTDEHFERSRAAMETMLAAMDGMDESRRRLLGDGHQSVGQRELRNLSVLLDAGAALLILENPTAGLDAPARQEFYRELTRATERGTAVVLVSSDTTELMTWTQRLLVFHEGNLEETWETRSVTRARIDSVFRGAPLSDRPARRMAPPPEMRPHSHSSTRRGWSSRVD